MAGSPRTCFARKQNDIVFRGGRHIAAFVRMCFVRFVNFVRGIGVNVLSESRDMQRVFVRRVSFGFGNSLWRTGDFPYLRLLVVVLFD